MNPQISIVISTYGRLNEIDLLLSSLVIQDIEQSAFETIIIDQNDKIDLYPIVEKYKGKLDLVHYKTDVKGLSKAKNKGIDLAKGSIITFPDDDCTFYPDTISNTLRFFYLNPKIDVVFGSVFERSTNTNVMRNWPIKESKLNLFNFSLRYSAITCFTKLKMKFNENYGVGSKIWSGEELDYAIRAIKEFNVVYSPIIQVWHPRLDVLSMNNQKVYNYAYGYASIMRKNLNLIIGIVFLCSLCYQLLNFMKFFFFVSRRQKYFLSIKGRIDGFLNRQI